MSAFQLGLDRSGNANHFNADSYYLKETDLTDGSPTNNFATWNPLARRAALTNPTYSEGNLKIVHPNLSGNATYGVSSIGVDSGKYYCEILALDVVTAFSLGIATMLQWNGDGNRNSFIAYNNDGNVKKYTNVSSAEATYTDGDIIGIAFDITSETVAFYKNNALQHTVTSIDAGYEATYHVFAQCSTNDKHVANFGQDSSFAGNKTAQGNQDVNGIGDFFYAPPSGFLALCTENLPEPTVDPKNHFNTVLWTGNATDDRSITGVGFQPDFVWIKSRNTTNDHLLFDVVRGVGKYMRSNANDTETSIADTLQAFETDGFEIGADSRLNTNNDPVIAWCWKAGNANTAFSESGNNPAGTHRANVPAGFSIVSYVGTGSAGTVSHGLGAAPELMLIKNTGVNDNWAVYFGDNTDYAILNTTAGRADSANWWNDTSPTSSVFTVGTDHSVNADGENYIAYCWRSIDGFSKIGEYRGNGNADGPFVNTGFRPAFLLMKVLNTASDWHILDSARDVNNPIQSTIDPNSEAVAGSGSDRFDFTSNGFKLRQTSGSYNGNNSTYIYMAFAETPIKYSNPR